MEKSKKDLHSSVGEKPVVTNEMKGILTKSYFAYLCTVNEEGKPHVTPVFFIYDPESNQIYFMSSLRSRKIRNIHVNSNVSLTVDFRDPINPFNNEGVMIEGQARTEAEIRLQSFPSERIFLKNSAKRVYKMFQEKYPLLKQSEFQGWGSTRILEVLVSVAPRKIVHWGGGPKFTRVTL